MYFFRISVKLFQLVKLTGFAAEDVQDHVIVIQNDPIVVVSSLKMCGIHASLSELELHLAAKRLDLRAGTPRADNKIIGDDGLIHHVKHLNVLCLFCIKHIKDGMCQFFGSCICERRHRLTDLFFHIEDSFLWDIDGTSPDSESGAV